MAIDVGSAIAYLDLDTKKFKSGLNSAQSSLSSFTSKADSSSKNLGGLGDSFSKVGTSLTKTGKSLTTKVTAPIIALGTAAVTTTATFESKMSKVSAISGATGNNLESLKKKAMEMGAKTKFSASEAADAFSYMAMAGWKTEDMLDGIEGIMNLAASSGEDLATTSDIVTDALTAFGLQAKDSSHFADVLAKTASSANTNVSMMGESFKYVAPVAGALGYNVEDVSVALGLMANSGIKASSAGTALRTLLTNMAKPTDAMAAAMDKLGVSLDDGKGGMKTLNEVMTDLRKGFGECKIPQDEFKKKLAEIQAQFDSGNITKSKYNKLTYDLANSAYGAEGALKAELAATLAGKEGMSGLLAIVNSSEKDWNSLNEAIYNADGTAQNMADTMNDNLQGQFTILGSTLETIALQFGDMLLPYIKKVVAKLQELATWMTNLSDEQRDMVIKIAAVVAAIGPALLIIGKLCSAIGGIITVASQFGSIFSTIKAAVIGAQGAMAAGSATAGGLATAIGSILVPVAAVVAGVIALVAAWKTNFGNIRGITSEIVTEIKGIFNGIVDIFKSVMSTVKQMWDSDWGNIRTIVQKGIAVVEKCFNLMLENIKNVFKLFNQIIHGDFKGAFETLKTIVKNGIEGFKTIFKGIIDIAKTIVKTVLNTIKDFAVNLAKKIADGAKNAFNNFKTWLGKLPERAGYFLGLVLGKAIKFAVDFPKKAKQAASEFINKVVTFFKELPSKVANFFTKTVDKAANFAKNLPKKGKEAAKNFKEGMVNALKELPSKMVEVGKNIIKGVGDGITAMKDKVIGKVKSFGEGLLNGLKSALDIHSPSRRAKKEVGEMFAEGVIQGVKAKKSNAKKSAAELSQIILDGAKDKLDKLQTFNKISKEQEVDYWKRVLKECKKGSSAYVEAYKNMQQAKKDARAQDLSNAQSYWDKYTTYHNVSKEQEANYWKGVMKKFKKGSDEYLQAYKNYKSAKESIQSEELSKAQDYWDKYTTYHDVSKREEMEYWKSVMGSLKKGSKEYLQAYKNYKSAKEGIQAEEYSKAQEYWSNYTALNDVSLADEVNYWKTVMGNFKKGSKEYIEAYKNYKTAKENLNKEQAELDKKYAEDTKKVYDDLDAKIKELTDTYVNSVNTRKEQLLGAFKLFDSYEKKDEVSKDVLASNLGSQVEALKDYNENINELSKRSIPEELFSYISSLGVDALEQIRALNTMSDEELEAYSNLWVERETLAQKQAEDENAKLKEATEKSVAQAKQDAERQVSELRTQYLKDIKSLTATLTIKSKKTGESVTVSIAKGIEAKKSEVTSALSHIQSVISSYASNIASMTNNIVNSVSSASSASRAAISTRTSGSHKTGLDRVPYDGYVAELHQGERVLTKSQADAQDKNDSKGDTFIFNSPKAIDEKEAARQMKQAKREMALSY